MPVSVNMTRPEGQLNPGVPRRKPMSSCKCMLFLCFGLISFCGVALVLLVITSKALWNFLNVILAPHKSLYSEDITNRSAVVQPLIGRQQTFDIAATVWLRTRTDDDISDEEERKEQALFSDIILRDVHLSDNNLHTMVNFTMPTDVFRYANLTNYDLRGSVVLIPSSPSLLDYVTNYSSYIPNTLEVLPVRTWPFPLGSQVIQKKTLADEILDSFAVSVPLIQFHGIQSQCSAQSPMPKDTETSDVREGFDQEEDEELAQLAKPAASHATPKTDTTTAPNYESSFERTNGKDLSHNHPYIVTRTQIRAIDEEGIFDRTAFFKVHRRLKATSCGQGALPKPNQYSCKGNYFHNGNWETLLQLRVPDESTREIHKEWAYAPYFYLSRYGFGQKDLLAAPVQREKCTENGIASQLEAPSLSKAVPERSTVDVSWKVSYIGRSPAKMALLDVLEMPKWYSFNTTDEAIIYEHRNSELKHGILGGVTYSENAHPRRHFFSETISTFLIFVITCLDIYYWHRRISTQSISTLGTTLIAASSILGALNTIIPTVAGHTDRVAYEVWIIFVASLHSLVLPLCQLKAVHRINIDLLPGHWIPTLRQTEASHLERVSERLEAQITKVQKFALFLCALTSYYFFSLQERAVIPAVTTSPGLEVPMVYFLPDYVFGSLDVVGQFLVITLNWQSRSFGGKTRASAILTAVVQFMRLVWFVPSLVREFDTRGALYAHEVLMIVIDTIIVWQALTLPKPREISYEDHSE